MQSLSCFLNDFFDRRPTWDEMFMAMAVMLYKRVTCCYYQVGAVLAEDDQMIGFGYNGPARGDDHCKKVGCAKLDEDGNKLPPGSAKCRGVHAEMNTLSNRVRPAGDGRVTLYVTTRPCFDCGKVIANHVDNIKRVVYLRDYDGEENVIDYLRRRKVDLIKFETISDLRME